MINSLLKVAKSIDEEMSNSIKDKNSASPASQVLSSSSPSKLAPIQDLSSENYNNSDNKGDVSAQNQDFQSIKQIRGGSSADDSSSNNKVISSSKLSNSADINSNSYSNFIANNSELKAQVANLQSLCDQYQNDIAQMSRINSEKIAKVKQVLAANQKTIAELKEQIAVKNQELNQVNGKYQQLEKDFGDNRALVSQLQSQLDYSKQQTVVRDQEIEQTVQELNNRIQSIQVEYQTYKKQAQTLIQQNQSHSGSTDSEAQQKLLIQELELQVDNLHDENTHLASKLKRQDVKLNEQKLSLEQMRQQLMDREQTCDALQKQLTNKDQQLVDLNLLLNNTQQTVDDQSRKVKELQLLNEQYLKSIRDKDQQITVLKQEHAEELQRLRAEFESKHSIEMQQMTDRIEELEIQVQTSQRKISQSSQVDQQSNTSLRSPTNQQLSQLGDNMLVDVDEIKHLRTQVVFLQQELRKLEEFKSRPEVVNTEYLKTVILKFAEDPNESLVQVLTKILLLQPPEIQKLRQSVARRQGSVDIWSYLPSLSQQ
ncbi:hypothetical protein MIR68_007805 [Amoeboaphelidium protococcarum]|nr:hypothetical protein MIR68_007805 [Amoeboaphelidium protococcarum]